MHAKYQDYFAKAAFTIIDGKISEVTILQERGTNMLPQAKIKDFADFLEHYGDRIVEKWIDYFVLHKRVNFEKINTRVK